MAALDKQPQTPEVQRELWQVQEELARQRTELTRVSDGCGKPRV